ncbi:DNA-binding protein [Planctomycetales bacterium]|nr:DNA-binding protein [Planctomycetales bacterium]
MNANRVFLDTNLLVYMYADDDRRKQRLAMRAFVTHECVVSTQVLSEFCNVAHRKLRLPLEVIGRDIEEILRNCELFIIDAATIQHALILQGRYGYSYYDSQILAAAQESGCGQLFTEDLADGQRVGELTINNVFRE